MAGFINRMITDNFLGSKSSAVSGKDIITIGLKYDDMVINNSQAIGVSQDAFGSAAWGDEGLMRALSMQDIGNKKNIAIFDKEYTQQREYLRKFALNGEIENILDIVADESIVYDEKNFFCQISTVFADVDLKKEIIDDIQDNFKKIYTYFNFMDDTTAWDFYRQFLVDGFLAFEIIYDDAGKHIIGFKELDPYSLRPDIEEDQDGTSKKVWYQYENDIHKKNKLEDSQVIYIAYAKNKDYSRISYVERLVRSFNLLRILENSRIIWNLMNSTYRLKMVVPQGSKSPQRAKESLAELRSIFKEDIDLNFDSGELFVQGKPGMQFYKNYIIPSKAGEQVEIETLSADGPDLSDTEALSYFKEKLRLDSKIPASRLDSSNGGGTLSIGADGIDRDEIRFSKFINRLRSKFQEILFKPLYIQMILDYPELKDDELFKSQIGFKFNKDNVFEELKHQDIMQRRLDFIESMRNIMEADGTTPFFDPQYLMETYAFLTKEELDKNEKYKKEAKKKAQSSGTDDSASDGSGEDGKEDDDSSAAGTDNFGF